MQKPAVPSSAAANAGPGSAAPATSVPTGPASTDFEGVVLATISERTGYPVDFIDPDSDLEADLSVDSIKRAEVAGEVAARLGISVDEDDVELEELAKARTVRAMVGWLTEQVKEAAGPTAVPELGQTTDVALPPHDGPVGVAPERHVPRLIPVTDAAVESSSALAGAKFLITGDTPVATRMVELLREHGATARTGTVDMEQTPLADIDGLVLLDGLVPAQTSLLPEAFSLIKETLRVGPRWLLAAASSGERADGFRGLFRTIGQEYPQTTARFVRVDGAASADQLAGQLVDELLTGGQTPVVDRSKGGRNAFDLIPMPLGALAATGTGPGGENAASAQAVGLDSDSVVVLIGGARGITAWCARALAASRCRIELVGRTPLLDGPEDPDLALAADKKELRAVLVSQGMRSPVEIERAADAVLARREVDATCTELRELGSEVRYHTVDVRDREATHQLLKKIYSEHHRIDGLVYAAGILEDKLLADKAPESFARVFNTKVNGARAALDALDSLGCSPRFVVLFGSIAASFGSRGQSDYAAANDALESLGTRWAARTGNRCLTVHWGPWAPVGVHPGMVNAELSNEYARRGIELIDPEEGALSLLRELAWADPTVTSVVYTGPAR
jgi:NAD(P)-dependent dehydrogenase (short-subunit alcohol dehydrogenase family)/acyl carrier protein